jgi:hypothetical protein
MLKMLQLDICLCHGVDAREVQVAGCGLRVAGCGLCDTTCIVCLLRIYPSCAFAVQTGCLRKFSSAAFAVCVTVA